MLTSARTYNTSLNGVPILDPWLTRVSRDPSSPAYRSYLAELSATDAMARLRVPSIGVDLPIYHGTTEAVLAKGIGHLYGTTLPVGGEGNHTVLTSHTGLSNATLLDHLIDVTEGQLFFIDVAGETLAYQVDQIKIVLPNQIDDLKPVDGVDVATLFTCTPYAVNSHRLLVRGHRVPLEAVPPAAVAAEASPDGLESWMYWQIGAGAASLVVFATLVVLTAWRRRSSVGDGVARGIQRETRGARLAGGGRPGRASRGRHRDAPKR